MVESFGLGLNKPPRTRCASARYRPPIAPAPVDAIIHLTQCVSHTMYEFNGVRKSTPPQHCQRIVLIRNNTQ